MQNISWVLIILPRLTEFLLLAQVFVPIVFGKYAQVLEWYTSTLEVRMPQGVGVRVSSWVRQKPGGF